MPKYDAVESHLDGETEQDGVDGHLAFRVDFGEEFREGEAVVTGEGVEGAGSLGHEAVCAKEHDDSDHGCEEAGADDGVSAVVEDLD